MDLSDHRETLELVRCAKANFNDPWWLLERAYALLEADEQEEAQG
ncbi:MAG TPA: hypothetical protein VMV09_02105 [Candidatus Saccharimonadales bacterium]|nr:hypothetical protein [Candidatus Saccharimonadales bacterium]